MSEILQSISERTDESLVRTMAEWIWHDLSDAVWTSTPGCGSYLEANDHEWWFQPHESGPQSSADRERMMLAMQINQESKVSHTPYGDSHNGFTWAIDHKDALFECAAITLGRAFCEAVVMWIEAQEDVP